MKRLNFEITIREPKDPTRDPVEYILTITDTLYGTTEFRSVLSQEELDDLQRKSEMADGG